MPLTFDDLSNPLFLQLPIAEQQKGRQALYDEFNKDPMFRQLPEAERNKLLKVDTAGTFAARQAAMGGPPAETAAELGGLHAPPPPIGSRAFNITRSVAGALGLEDPITAIPMYAAAGAGTIPLKAGMAFGAFGAERGATEAMQRGEDLSGIVRGALGTGLREGIFGAALPLGTATSSTVARGIVRPLAVGAGVGFLTAPPGERLEGALEGAATFGGFKLAGRAIGGASNAVRSLFRREPPGTVAGGSIADAPAGLTEEVFGPPPRGFVGSPKPISELDQFARFYEGKLPPEEMLQRNIEASTAQGEAYLREKGRMPIGGLPEPFKPPTGVGPIGPEIKPPSVYVPGPPIRQGPPEIRALPPPEASQWSDVVDILSQRARRGGSLNADEAAQLQQWVADPAVPNNVQGLASRLLRETAPGAPIEIGGKVEAPVKASVTEPPPPPIVEPPADLTKLATGKPSESQIKAEAGDIVSAIADITANKGVKFGKDVRSDVRESLIASGLPKNLFNYKSGMPAGDVVEQLSSRGFPMTTENELIDSLRLRAKTGPMRPVSQAAAVEAAMTEGLKQESVQNLFGILGTAKSPEDEVARAALMELKNRGINIEIPKVVRASEIGDDFLKQVLQGQFGIKPNYTKAEVVQAEQWAKRLRPNPDPLDDLNKINQSGALNDLAGIPRFEKTPAGQQGMIPGTEGRNIPQGGLQAGRGQTEALTPLEKASIPETQGDILGNVGPRGGVDIGGPGNAPTNSWTDDLFSFFKRWGTSFKDNEGLSLVAAFGRRTHAAQELARQHPAFKPIYDAFHAYPRASVNAHVEDITPLFEKKGPLGENMPTYFTQPDNQRMAIDKAAMFTKTQRQGQNKLTANEARQRFGLTDEMYGIYNDVLDYGKRILDAHRNWYIESRLPVLVESGMSEGAARASLEAQAAKALQGLDHWVPSYRAGDKTVTVRDALNNVMEFRLEPNIKSRINAVEELKAKYPAERGYKISEGTLDNFVRSKAFDEIDMASLEILSRFARVDPTVSEQFMSQIRPALLQRSDAMARFKKFENIPGFKEDLREGLINSGKAAHNYIERQKAYQAATDGLGKIDQSTQKELFNFSQQYIDDNMVPGDRRMQTVRDLTYSYLLGGNIKQYPLQLTQFVTTVMPEMAKFASPREVVSAAKMATKWTFASTKELAGAPQELQAAWLEAFKQGVFQPRVEMFTGEKLKLLGLKQDFPFQQARIEEAMAKQLHGFEGQATQHLKTARDIWMSPITDADMRTRMGAFNGFYEIGRKVRGMSPVDATKFAIDEANRTNFLYGAADSPQLFGRRGVVQFANMLKSWTASYISFLRGVYGEAAQEATQAGATGFASQLGHMGKAAMSGPSAARTLASSMGAMFALGGTLYNLPGPLRNAISAGLGVDPETEARKLLSGQLGLPDMATEAVLRGLPAIGGVDMSRSLALGDTMPTTLAELVGPTPTMIGQIGIGIKGLYDVATQPFGPDPKDVLERMAGGGLKNVFKANRLLQEGISTRAGGQLPGSEQLRAVDPYLQVLGFTPLSVSQAQAGQRVWQMEQQRHRDQQANMLEALSKAIVNQDQEKIAGIQDRIRRINESAAAENRPDKIVTIDRGSLRQHIAEMLAPGASIKRVPRNARQRLLELQNIYNPPPPPD